MTKIRNWWIRLSHKWDYLLYDIYRDYGDLMGGGETYCLTKEGWVRDA